MSDQSYTARQAADPQTPAQTLADIAAVRPDLRPAVASNPSAYPSLLQWLGSLGEPSVDAALKARPSASDAQQTAVLPTAGSAGPVGSTAYGSQPGQGGQPGYGSQPGQNAAAGHPAQSPYGVQPAYGAQPGQGGQSPYGGQAPYGAQPGAVPPYGTTPGYAGYQPTPAKSGSKKALWIILAVVGVLLVLGVVGAIVIGNLIRNAIPDEAAAYGDDPALDALYDRCEAEDWAACDQLYEESPIGSEYEEFGDTCGFRTSGGTLCTDEFAEGDAAEPGDTTTEDPGTQDPGAEATAYGDDPELDALWDRCAAGEGVACDELFTSAPYGSQYEEFGSTCGGTTDGTAWCDEAGAGAAGTSSTYGDDPALDALWDACAGGDDQACDDLYTESPIGSEYEEFGNTCAGRGDGTTWCVP